MGRIDRLLGVARRLADAGDPLGAAARRSLPSATGLSPEGVDLALRRHLETEADLAAFVGAVPRARTTWVVLSANVFTGALRALVLACAVSDEVRVRPSRREPETARLLVDALADAGVSLVTDLAPAAGDQVHAYGRDETLARIRASLPEGVRFFGHGAGFGVAELGPGDDVARLADDVVVFDQRGCLSPRVGFVIGEAREAEAVAERLDAALAGSGIPEGELSDDERARRRAFLDASAMAGWAGRHVAVERSPRSLVLPPAPRLFWIANVPALDDARALLAPHARFVTALGGRGGLEVVVPRARRSALGEMQRPPLDGWIDRRHG